MFFLKKKPLFNQNSQVNPSENVSVEENQMAVNSENIAASVETTEERPADVTGPVFFSKFLRNQKMMSGPEASYENEAWAPEFESVGLFRKHRAMAEEQPSSSSGLQ